MSLRYHAVIPLSTPRTVLSGARSLSGVGAWRCHGPRKLTEYESDGSLVADGCTAPACAAVARWTSPVRSTRRGFVPLSVSWAGLPAWTTRCAPTCSPCRPRIRGGRLFAAAPPVCAGVPAAAVGAIWQPRWTSSEVRSRIGNQLLSAADPPAPSGARSAHRPAPPKRTMCHKTGQLYLLPTSAEPAELHRRYGTLPFRLSEYLDTAWRRSIPPCLSTCRFTMPLRRLGRSAS